MGRAHLSAMRLGSARHAPLNLPPWGQAPTKDHQSRLPHPRGHIGVTSLSAGPRLDVIAAPWEIKA